MKSTKKQISIGTAAFVIVAVALINTGANADALSGSESLVVSENTTNKSSPVAGTDHAHQHSPDTDQKNSEAVNVVLNEWDIVPDKTTVSAGPITFKVINVGPSDVHEIAVVKTDLAPADFPVDDNGNVDENSSDLNIIGEIEDIAVGASAKATFDLEPGNYVLICNIWDAGEKESHYAEGMFITFKVQ